MSVDPTASPATNLDGGLWFRVENPASASAARRAAERLAGQLGLPERRIADLGIVVAELTSNLVKHADEGLLSLRAARRDGGAGVELLAIDSGPGMADLAAATRDGHSTSGTLGIGLGAIARQATWYDVYSRPGRGTVLVAEIWPGRVAPPAWSAGLSRPITGESVSGDGFATRVSDGGHQLLVCDGLGHGPLAAAAAQAAVTAFRAAPEAPPATVLAHLHANMTHTRGAAVAIAELDVGAGVVRFAGLGNIASVVLMGDERRGMVSLPGIVGHQRRSIREFEYPLAPGAVVVLHSDGVADRWSASDYPGLLDRAPHLLAATVLRDGGVRRDDACVLAAKATP